MSYITLAVLGLAVLSFFYLPGIARYVFIVFSILLLLRNSFKSQKEPNSFIKIYRFLRAKYKNR